MSRLRFRYYMKLSFDGPAEKHRFTLKCIPVSDEKQEITLYKKDIYPNSFISEGTDSFGNALIYGYEESEHKCFFFDIRGEAVCGEEGMQLRKDKLYYKWPFESVFKYPTKCTAAGEGIKAYAGKLDRLFADRDSEERVKAELVAEFAEQYYREFFHGSSPSEEARYAILVMNRLFQDFKYMGGVTEVGTTAEEAFRRGRGVCQDYAHIMIAILRLRRIPCRYVTGMTLGEGASHAWIEVYTNGFWLPLDPTNGIVVMDQHIKIAHGRDFSDCLVNQGVFVGNSKQNQEITVYVEKTDGSKK